MSAASKDFEPLGAGPARVTGVILAGGRSRRYGRDKALAQIEGVPLIERVMGIMESVFDRLILIANSTPEYAHLRLPIYEDLVKGIGPLGGIYTGLKTIRDEGAFFVACDMPFLNRVLIHHMVHLRKNYAAVVPRIGRKIEALHAFYSKRCLPAIETMIASKHFQIAGLYPNVRVRYVEESDIRTYDPDLRSFFNVNSPRELAAAEEMAQKANDAGSP
jgi:molybdopterin-guanine dinucleotide biosynthesis protein A